MINVTEVNQLQKETVVRWHQFDIDNRYEGIFSTICQQHSFNFLLWHEEDIARSHEVTDQRIAQVKRAIDGYNQKRNDWIEKIDDQVTGLIESNNIKPDASSTLNTETSGSVIDRLSIMSLRIYHLQEQLDRTDVSDDHTDSVKRKIAVCLMQQADLSSSLQQLIDDIFSGRKCHRTYRQFKMYNDPTLNPYLYQAQKRLAG